MPTLQLAALAGFVFAVVFASAPVSAQEAIGTYSEWSAYQITENGNKVCYIYSQPIKQDGNYSRRGEPFAMVTRRKGRETFDEVSVTSGYPYKPKTPVQVKVDAKTFDFSLISDEHAWIKDEEADAKLVKEMIRGLRFSVRGTSHKNTFSIDTYSLKGFTAAHKAIAAACP